MDKTKAITLLGDGVPPERVAAALGVTPSAISQLMSDEEISHQVAELRYEKLSAHSARDAKADRLEDRILDKLEDTIDTIHRPLELARVYSVVNAAKRRGSSAPEHVTNLTQVLNLSLPTKIINNYQVNQNNQVIQVDSTSLNTIQSSALLSKLRDSGALKEQSHVPAIEERVVSSG